MPIDPPPLFDSLPPKPKVPGRLRTNEDWLEQQPDLYQEIKDRIMGGDTNVRRLAQHYAPLRWNAKTQKLGITEDAMRRAITAMINNDITLEKFDEIVQSKLSILRGEMVDVASDVGSRVQSTKELGAVAMTMKLASDTIAGMGGAPQPVIRHEHLHVHTTPDELQRRREQALRQMQSSPAPATTPETTDPLTLAEGNLEIISPCPTKTPLTSI